MKKRTKLKLNKLKLGLAALPILLLSAHSYATNGDLQINFVNKNSNNKVYFLVKGSVPNTDNPVFVKFDKDNPDNVGVLTDITQGTQSEDFGIDMSNFPNGLHMPYLQSGRIYLSVDNKIHMQIVKDGNGVFRIADPDVNNTGDANNKTLFDKVEFTYNTDGTTYINPTAVDFISLPIAVEQDGVTYGTTESRADLFNNINAVLNQSTNSNWLNLLDSDDNGLPLRLRGAGRDNAFDENYLDNATDYGYSYLDGLFNYYKENILYIDVHELYGNGGAPQAIRDLPREELIFGGKVNSDGNLEFTNKYGNFPVIITRDGADLHPPASTLSRSFFLAAQGTFNTEPNTPRGIIVRELSAAWAVGLLPAPNNSFSQPLGKAYWRIAKETNQYFQPNDLLGHANSAYYGTGPWYNLYSEAIHSVSFNLYATPYDDAVLIDGTNAKNDQFPVTLTLADLDMSSYNKL